jgi:predicted alpha/beta-hydrolase family hydrolase
MIRSGKSTKGSVLVELAISLPLLVVLLTSVIAFGWLMYVHNAVERTVRDAARYAASRTFQNATEFQTAIRNVVVYGTPAGGGSYRVPGLDAANMNAVVTVLPILNGPASSNPSLNRPARIRISVASFMDVPDIFMMGALDAMTNRPVTMEVPFLGRYAPVAVP